jgi:hypothetical protein
VSTSNATPAPNPYVLNAQAAQAILRTAVPASQPIFSQVITPASVNNQVSVNLQNVGLQRYLILKVVATIANTDGAVDATLGPIGAPNLLTNIVFRDQAQYARIDTTGAHLFAVDTIKQRSIFGAGFTTDNPKYAALWKFISAPATIVHGTSGTVVMYYRIPIAYLDDDFRGAIWGGVTSSTMSLSWQFNPTPGMATGGAIDTTNAIYTGTNALTITSATCTVYQHYYDQIPTNPNGGLMLPLLSMQTMCELKWSPFPAIPAGADFPLPFTNQRAFLSYMLYYNNFPNPAAAGGADINYLRLVQANTYQHWKYDPTTAALQNRLAIGDDFPPGFYMFDVRNRPISTVQWGNMALNINALTANAGAYANMYYEMFSQAQTIGGAQGLAA